MEELHRTHKPVQFGWLKTLGDRKAAPRRATPARARPHQPGLA